MVKQRKNALSDCVFRPLAALAIVLCALSAVIGAIAVWLSAPEAVSWLIIAAAVAYFILTCGVSIWLIRLVCRRYLVPVTQAADVVAQAAAGDHSADLSDIPRTSRETDALLAAAGDMGLQRTGCLMELEEVLRRIGEGDLTARLSCGKSRECGGACGALDGMAQSLRGAIGSVRSALEQLSGRLDELEQTSGRLYESAQSRCKGQEALNRSLDHLNRSLDGRTEEAQAVSIDAEKLLQLLAEDGQRLEELIRAIERIADCAAEAGKIVKAMESTAFQCSILARTAYMEAAGAGINGKGFAVVASEMRVLASRSAQAAQDAAAFMEEMDQTIREGCALSAGASRELLDTVNSAQSLRGRAARAALASGETGEAQEAVRQAVRLAAAGAEDQRMVAQAAASARLLQERAARLRETLRIFRLN